MFNRIPDSLIINGFKFKLQAMAKPSLDMRQSVINYEIVESNDYMVSQILGFVFEAALQMNGVTTDRSKKISIDKNQLLRIMERSLFCFLRDNTVDWRMVALNTPLLEETSIIEPIVVQSKQTLDAEIREVLEKVVSGDASDGPSLEETASQAMDDIGGFEYDAPGDL